MRRRRIHVWIPAKLSVSALTKYLDYSNTAPSIPENVVASSNDATVTVVFSPSDSLSPISLYRVYESSVLVGTTTASPYVENNVSNGTKNYSVSAVNVLGLESAKGSAAPITVTVTPPAPGAAIYSSITVISSTRIDHVWAASTTGGTTDGYQLDRSLTGAGGWANVYTGPNLTFSDTGLTASTQYFYRLLSFNGVIPAVSYATGNATTQSGVLTAFSDLSGQAFAGEPGAIAIRDTYPTYSYSPQFAPTIPTIPTYSAAAHQIVITGTGTAARTALANALSAGGATPTYRHIFIQKGTDMHGEGDIAITNGGTVVTPRWIIYYDNADVNKDLTTFQPWNLAVGSASRTQLCRLSFETGSAYYYVVGLNWGKIGSTSQKWCAHLGNANNIVHYRCSAENTQAGSAASVAAAGCNAITFYQCRSWWHFATGAGDVHGFSISNGANIKIVSCEGGDQSGDFIQFGNGATVTNCVMEDCDVYNTRFTNSAGVVTAGGEYVDGEGALDCKAFNGIKVYGNRIWGMRETAPTGNHGAGSGAPIRFSQNNSNKKNFDCRWNVIDDSSDGGILLQGATSGGTVDGRHSVVRNIINNVRPVGGNKPISVQDYNSEVYLNTVSNCPTASCNIGFVAPQPGTTTTDCDVRGNLFITVPAMIGAAALATAATVGYNAFVATTGTNYNKGLTGTDQTSSIAAANLTNFNYTRKKLTAPETAQIAGIILTTTTPTAIKTMVPTTGANRPGARTGLGVSDVAA